MLRPNIFVTCPPMLGLIEEFAADFDRHGLDFTPAKVSQVLSEEELVRRVAQYDGWIIGDDPASRPVIQSAAQGKLKAAVKWGVGVDNVDFEAFKDLNIPVENTPGVFGEEVADVAIAYAIGLARETYFIDRAIRQKNAWPKPCGISISGRTVAIVGFGDIGKHTARRVSACGGRIIVYDPAYIPAEGVAVETSNWPDRLDEADFIIFTCPLTAHTRGMLNPDILDKFKTGVRVVNVSRGPVIDEAALIRGLQTGKIHSAALDVFETEPLPTNSPLRDFDRCIFGSHNGSNSVDAVRRVSRLAIEKIAHLLTLTKVQ